MTPSMDAGRSALLWAAAAAAVVTAGAAYDQNGDAQAWLGITKWSGTIRVEVAQESDAMGTGTAVLNASASGTVDLDLADVRDGPTRAIWIGENQAFSATHQAKANMGNGAIVATESGDGVSPDGTLKLLINLDNLTYVVDLEVGHGIEGQAVIQYVGGYGNETKSVDIHLDELDVRTDEIRLPSSSPGGLTGTYAIDLAWPDGGGRRTGSLTWSLSPCVEEENRTLEIDPFLWDALVFDQFGSSAGLQQTAIANNVTPEEVEDLIQWTFPEIPGVTLTTRPEDNRGSMVTLDYRSMPEDNSDFDGERTVTATLPGCTEVRATLPARFFFNVSGTGNPDDAEVPNWFYYWRQTAAGQGLTRSQVRYAGTERCARTDSRGNAMDLFGTYLPGTDYISLCDAVTGSSWNKVTGEFTDGIDTYAATVLHEREHQKHWEDWWLSYNREWVQRTGLSVFDDPTAYQNDRKEADRDQDDIPDSLEAALGMDPELPDTHNCKMTDEHYLAWLAEGLWNIGSADAEDWAAPGKQYGNDPVQRNAMRVQLCGIAQRGG